VFLTEQARGLRIAIVDDEPAVRVGLRRLCHALGVDATAYETGHHFLDALRDGGRCVGVVSHVSDLRSRVPAQVRVDKTSTGSSVTVLGLDNPAA